MPAARLAISVTNGVCASCNVYRPRQIYVEGNVGFKNNGACVTTMQAREEIKRAQPVRG